MKLIRSIKDSFLQIVITILLGTLWHFIFDWLDKNIIIAAICPVNESIWEHLKLLFYPVLLFSIVEYIFKSVKSSFLVARTIGVLSGMLAIIVLYYTYSGIIGKDNTVMDIIIYILSIFITYGVSGMLKSKRCCSFFSYKFICAIILIIIVALFTLFTYNPPKINLFRDQTTDSYSYEL